MSGTRLCVSNNLQETTFAKCKSRSWSLEKQDTTKVVIESNDGDKVFAEPSISKSKSLRSVVRSAVYVCASMLLKSACMYVESIYT